MTQTGKTYRSVKPVKCECHLAAFAITPPARNCKHEDYRQGAVVINGTRYALDIIGYRQEFGPDVIDGYRLTKEDGTAHDVCLVAGRHECTCGDYDFRRAAQQDEELCECKHISACRQLLSVYWPLRDLYEQRIVETEEALDELETLAVQAGEYAVEFDDP